MTRLRWLWKRITTSTTYRGVPFTLLWVMASVLGLASTKWFIEFRARHFDRRHGVETAEVIHPPALGITAAGAEHSMEYEPCTPEMLAGALSNLSIEFSQYAFIDLGSGMGVALLAASLFPFKRIVGIEWSKRIADIARENVRKFTHPEQACRSIEVRDGDATAYELPREPLVIFLFNPFKEPLVRRFVENLNQSLRECPRHVMVVYCNPVCRQAFDEAKFLREVDRAGDRAPVATYESIGRS